MAQIFIPNSTTDSKISELVPVQHLAVPEVWPQSRVGASVLGLAVDMRPSGCITQKANGTDMHVMWLLPYQVTVNGVQNDCNIGNCTEAHCGVMSNSNDIKYMLSPASKDITNEGSEIKKETVSSTSGSTAPLLVLNAASGSNTSLVPIHMEMVEPVQCCSNGNDIDRNKTTSHFVSNATTVHTAAIDKYTPSWICARAIAAESPRRNVCQFLPPHDGPLSLTSIPVAVHSGFKSEPSWDHVASAKKMHKQVIKIDQEDPMKKEEERCVEIIFFFAKDHKALKQKYNTTKETEIQDSGYLSVVVDNGEKTSMMNNDSTILVNGQVLKRHCAIADKKFACKVCGKRYKYETNLISHATVHTAQALECEYCHKVRNLDEKPIMSSTCVSIQMNARINVNTVTKALSKIMGMYHNTQPKHADVSGSHLLKNLDSHNAYQRTNTHYTYFFYILMYISMNLNGFVFLGKKFHVDACQKWLTNNKNKLVYTCAKKNNW
ncbi:hypothetical protein RFI_00075 [Reticulomyxa filosa]|uniref:C2H2-type domain-containing protein n=1 Tax=Reticulomyxa filosa TaxID=46433 RepID=X6PFV9_RETFI|nr:hypothetical protein RFI_00075 [Reticulomyxa filosa]|eukprot:ETO36988.1 hypothetical protein RFI_00075 [Reticulomyxa filosa]